MQSLLLWEIKISPYIMKVSRFCLLIGLFFLIIHADRTSKTFINECHGNTQIISEAILTYLNFSCFYCVIRSDNVLTQENVQLWLTFQVVT